MARPHPIPQGAAVPPSPGPHPWAMRGEVNAKHRPVNSLLEDTPGAARKRGFIRGGDPSEGMVSPFIVES